MCSLKNNLYNHFICSSFLVLPLAQGRQICSEVLLRLLGRQQRDDLLHIGVSPLVEVVDGGLPHQGLCHCPRLRVSLEQLPEYLFAPVTKKRIPMPDIKSVLGTDSIGEESSY